ncbi:ATP-binding protein [Mycolicibacterium wolinskyi]|uniref:ATP-binding protein n=1 Tax=Mycolicibacterium wolinskyi TaxID=59750 RepID=UPI0039178DB3
MQLIGRSAERAMLDAIVAALRTGSSRALVVHGDAGMGKTALLDYLSDRAPDCRVVRAAGVEAETELAFAALHAVCAPVLDRAERLPAPQRHALLTAFGMQPGPAPDRFLVGLAVLGLFSEATQTQPLLVLIDDQQWLDQASAQILAFVARRLAAEAVGLVLATRVPSADLTGLPALRVDRLTDDESRSLLRTVLTGPLDVRVRDQIVAEARGNPLALLELPRALTPAELAGGFGLPGALARSLDGTFRHQLDTLPAPSRTLLALAAAEPSGDPVLLWAATTALGIPADAAEPVMEAGLAEFGTRVRFRHPLVRSAAYRCVALSDRQRIHRALAAVIDPETDSVRRAWHLGHGTAGPDEDVAAELERSAEQVQARGGVSAAASFLERAAALTIDPARRSDRAITAASAKARAGLLDAARDLLKIAEATPLTELQRARADLVRAQLALISSHGNAAAPLLLSAARRLEDIDATLARETYLDALSAAIFAGRLAVDAGMVEISELARSATRPLSTPGPADLLLDGLATQYSVGFVAGLPAIHAALRQYGHGMTTDQELRWMFLACFAAARVWDIDRQTTLAERYVQLVRDNGAVTQLPLALSALVVPLLFTGQFDAAASGIDEMCAAIDAMGKTLTPFSAIILAALRGRQEEVDARCDAAQRDALRRGEGFGLTAVAWCRSLIANSRGDYRTAREAAQYASAGRGDAAASWWSLTELVEAASRLKDTATATAALARLTEMTTPSATDWGLGVEARSRALLSEGDTAELLYREAIERCRRAGLRPDLARSHLLYGEWLRRQRRRVDARLELRCAHELFEEMGMTAFAERARGELAATGEKARRRAAPDTAGELTAQEAQIARLAREGLSNPEIGARLFISARTVQYHLAKVFAKLAIRSRSQLDDALTDSGG